MKGRLLVIDGLDGSGKATQVALLHEYLTNHSVTNFAVDFLRYGKESCVMVEKYLNGSFGTDPFATDPYTASMFYTIDRSISYKAEKWGKMYENGYLIVSDRYTSSNIIHQGSKLFKGGCALIDVLSRRPEFVNFVKWIYETEYIKIGLPKPDIIINLYLSDEANRRMIKRRREENQDRNNNDIHETNFEYLNQCRSIMDAYRILIGDSYTKTHYGLNDVLKGIVHEFIRVDDPITHEPRPREDILNDIISVVKKYNLMG